MDLQGIAEGVGKLDPFTSAIDWVASALHLPPAISDIAKVAVGVALGDPMAVITGAVGLAGDLLGAPAVTEHVPPKHAASGCPGYARPPGGKGGGTGTEAGRGRGGAEGAGCADRSVRDLLSNPNMSIEDKMQAVLQHISEATDKEAENVMQQMADIADKRAGTQDEREAKKLDQSYEQLNLRLQKCMERRQQMFSLMSNVSEKFNEMAKLAIQNLGRA